MYMEEQTPADVIVLLRNEREKSVSIREWKHRMVGYGYDLRKSDRGDFVHKLGSTQEICEVPAELLH